MFVAGVWSCSKIKVWNDEDELLGIYLNIPFIYTSHLSF